jgi:hypothetical protein
MVPVGSEKKRGFNFKIELINGILIKFAKSADG